MKKRIFLILLISLLFISTKSYNDSYKLYYQFENNSILQINKYIGRYEQKISYNYVDLNKKIEYIYNNNKLNNIKYYKNGEFDYDIKLYDNIFYCEKYFETIKISENDFFSLYEAIINFYNIKTNDNVKYNIIYFDEKNGFYKKEANFKIVNKKKLNINGDFYTAYAIEVSLNFPYSIFYKEIFWVSNIKNTKIAIILKGNEKDRGQFILKNVKKNSND